MSTLTHVRFGGPTAVVARRSSSGSAAVRVIEYTLDGAPDADPPYRVGRRACCAARQDAWGFLLAHLAIRRPFPHGTGRACIRPSGVNGATTWCRLDQAASSPAASNAR